MKKKIVAVVLITILVGSVLFCLTGIEPENGAQADDENGARADEYDVVWLTPITENATLEVPFQLVGNAVVIPTFHREDWWGSNRYYDFDFGYLTETDYLIENFDRVYIAYDSRGENPTQKALTSNESVMMKWYNQTFVFYLFAYDNGARFVAELTRIVVPMTLDDAGMVFTASNGFEVTYTIHYQRIIGWEDP